MLNNIEILYLYSQNDYALITTFNRTKCYDIFHKQQHGSKVYLKEFLLIPKYCVLN